MKTKFFTNIPGHPLEKFTTLCKKIEKDANYWGSRHRGENYDLFAARDNMSDPDAALVISSPPAATNTELGKIYRISTINDYGSNDDGSVTSCLYDSIFVLIERTGNVLFYEDKELDRYDKNLTFGDLIPDKDIYSYLGRPSLCENVCKKIESDANYQPNISNLELLNLVVDKAGYARHQPLRSALAIQPIDIYRYQGRAYLIKTAEKGLIDGYYRAWHIADYVVMSVERTGEISFHDIENAKNGDFSQPFLNRTPAWCLGHPSLHPKVEKPNTVANLI